MQLLSQVEQGAISLLFLCDSNAVFAAISQTLPSSCIGFQTRSNFGDIVTTNRTEIALTSPLKFTLAIFHRELELGKRLHKKLHV